MSKGMPVELREALRDQRRAFAAKFGREPDPGEPIFFDPDKGFPMPAPLSKIPAGVVEAMLMAGFDEADVEAFLRALTT